MAMMMNSGLQQQVLHRPKAELAFRPWWDSVEDTMLAAMLAIGNDWSWFVIIDNNWKRL